jgi:CRP-like cAMP-binding protein
MTPCKHPSRASERAPRFPRNRPIRGYMDLAKMLDDVACRVIVRAGVFLFREGDKSAGVYVLRSGRVALVWQTGDVWPMDVVDSGSVIGLAAAINGVCSLGAKVEQTEMGFVPRDTFLKLLESSPSFSTAVTLQLAREIARMRGIAAMAKSPRTEGGSGKVVLWMFSRDR